MFNTPIDKHIYATECCPIYRVYIIYFIDGTTFSSISNHKAKQNMYKSRKSYYENQDIY